LKKRGFLSGTIYKFGQAYINRLKLQHKFRITHPGAFSWGNTALRAPLLLIGTDIYCFAQLSNKGKLLRYLKAASAIIPVAWSSFGMIIFLSSSTTLSVKDIDVYIFSIPVILVAATILVLDLSILNSQGGLSLKIIRGFFAILTGYILSSIPLTYYFKGSIDSYLAVNDIQKNLIESNYKIKMSAITAEPWFKEQDELEKNVSRVERQAENERLGNGIGENPKANTAYGKNPKYNEILKELEGKRQTLEKFRASHTPDINRVNQITSEYNTGIGNITSSNKSNHIKRHNALWSYAFSSTGSATFFIGILLMFWMIDALAVLSSFINEEDYYNLLTRTESYYKTHFENSGYDELFAPKIAEGTIE
jgi:hypothetical protein